MKKAFLYKTAMGEVGLAEKDGALTNLFIAGTVLPAEYILEETPLLKEAYHQLEEYLSAKRRTFELPFAPEGTAFEQRVWQALLSIPFGQIRTYSQIAQQIGSPKAARAVGRANSKNPISIFIPCHRVIGADGSLTGYAGGLKIKEFLLKLEGAL